MDELDVTAVMEVTQQEWGIRGMTPITIYLLMSKYGWSGSEIDSALNAWIGKDYIDVRQVEWAKRLAAHGAPVDEECTYLELLAVLDTLISYESMSKGL